MKKRILLIAMIIIVITTLVIIAAACNKQIVDFKLKFEHAYIKVGESWITVDVDKWNDYEGEQIQLILKDGTVLLVNSMNCILYQGTLPKN